MQLPFQMDAGGHMQEASSRCWHLSSPAMFLTPGSPWLHHTDSRVHGLQGLGAASPVGYRHPCSAKQKAAGWLCPSVQWLCRSQERCHWMGSLFLPSFHLRCKATAFLFCFLSHAVLSNVQSNAHAHVGFNTAGSHCHMASLLQ